MVIAMITAHANRILLSVEQHNAYDFSGQFFTPVSEQPVPFSSFSEFMVKLEQLFNTLQPPESSTEIRSFFSRRKREKMQMKQDIPLYNHEAQMKGQFLIHVLFRRNMSWQGRVEWFAQKRAVNFRSTMELAHLLLEALNHDSNKRPVQTEAIGIKV